MKNKNKNEPVVSLPFAPHEFPGARIGAAIANKANKFLCFVVGGGLGDRVCAEPTLRFALENFKDVTISLICETPELFRHLKFKEVFDLKKTYPVVGRHLYLNTYPKSPLYNQFINANGVDLVDYASISALRMQLPTEYKCPQLFPKAPERKELVDYRGPSYILVHPGQTWASRTFPADWWNRVILEIHKQGFRSVIIGSQTVTGVEKHPEGVDLRTETSLDEFIWLCKSASALVTNDSSPLHLAASGEAAIAFVATSRRPDLLMHHRKGGKGWKMKDFSRRDMWRLFDMIPNHTDIDSVAELPPETKMEEFLPEPQEVITWIRKTI